MASEPYRYNMDINGIDLFTWIAQGITQYTWYTYYGFLEHNQGLYYFYIQCGYSKINLPFTAN